MEQQNKYRPKNKKNEIWDPLVIHFVLSLLFRSIRISKRKTDFCIMDNGEATWMAKKEKKNNYECLKE